MGFDDIELAEIVSLTTVRQPLRESGALGAGALLALLEGREPERRPLPPLAVVQRATV